MRRWAMVSTLRQIGMKRPKWPRALMSISASVGEQWRQRFCQSCSAGLRLALPKTGQNGSNRQISDYCPALSIQADPVCRLGMPKPCA